MKILTLTSAFVLVAALPFAVRAESPDDSSTSKAGTGGNKEHLETKAAPVMKDGIVRRTDGVFVYQNGSPLKVDSVTVVAEEVTVDPVGKVTWKNGKEILLAEGQMIAFDGTLLQEPTAAAPDRDAIQGSSGAKD